MTIELTNHTTKKVTKHKTEKAAKVEVVRNMCQDCIDQAGAGASLPELMSTGCGSCYSTDGDAPDASAMSTS